MEIRPFREIVMSLDGQGKFDGMPFMPEMVQFRAKWHESAGGRISFAHGAERAS